MEQTSIQTKHRFIVSDNSRVSWRRRRRIALVSRLPTAAARRDRILLLQRIIHRPIGGPDNRYFRTHPKKHHDRTKDGAVVDITAAANRADRRAETPRGRTLLSARIASIR
jgi:hypothetical protein